MADSRTKNSIRNYSMTVISQITSILLSFIGRTFFIKFLSIEYLGINGLFSNILSLLSLAELGIGTAITYMMYKPIAEDDKERVAAYNQSFRKIYNWIGLFVLTGGLSLTPFIYHLIKEEPQISENLYIIYALFVINTSVSYFYTYKRSLLIAYQKEYINNQNIILFAVIKDVVLIALLYLFSDFYIYLIAQIIITIASNVTISIKTNKLFPEIVSMRPIKVQSNEFKIIVKNTMAMVCHKIGSVIVSGTSNIFVSYYVGLSMVGIYSNYIMISTAALQVVGKGINSLTASFGNLVATSNRQDIYKVFRKIYFINFVMALSIAIIYYELVDSFITIWIGDDFLLDPTTTIVIVVNSLFLYQMRIPAQMVINTCGLFWEIKWKSLVEAAVNLLCSFLFAGYCGLGILGVLLAAFVSNVATNLWWEPYVAMKNGLKIPIKFYIIDFMKSSMIFVLTLIIVASINYLLSTQLLSPLLYLLLRLIIAIVVIALIVLIAYGKSEEMHYVKSIVGKGLRSFRH